MTETIVAAAIQIEGVALSLPQPARHGQILACADRLGLPAGRETQGFLTSSGRFVNRVQARQIAHIAGQTFIDRGPHSYCGPDLFSEDLW